MNQPPQELHLADNGVTGSDVNESSLGIVPSATRADFAQDAGSLDGIDSSGLVRSFAAHISDQQPTLAFTVPERRISR